jgi:hypothetical protein
MKFFAFALFAALTTPALRASIETNLIENGSFESGHSVSSAAEGWMLVSSIPGWSKGSDTPFELQHGRVGGSYPSNGSTKVELDGAANASLFQVVPSEAGKRGSS